MGRDEAALLRGRPLVEAQELGGEAGGGAEHGEAVEFIHLSRGLEEQRRQEGEERRKELEASQLREQEAIYKGAKSSGEPQEMWYLSSESAEASFGKGRKPSLAKLNSRAVERQ